VADGSAKKEETMKVYYRFAHQKLSGKPREKEVSSLDEVSEIVKSGKVVSLWMGGTSHGPHSTAWKWRKAQA